MQIIQLKVGGMTAWPTNTYEPRDSFDKKEPAGKKGAGSKKIKWNLHCNPYLRPEREMDPDWSWCSDSTSATSLLI
jgi:hypothetical protein